MNFRVFYHNSSYLRAILRRTRKFWIANIRITKYIFFLIFVSKIRAREATRVIPVMSIDFDLPSPGYIWLCRFLCIWVYAFLSISPNIYLFYICLSVYLFICWCVFESICLSVYLGFSVFLFMSFYYSLSVLTTVCFFLSFRYLCIWHASIYRYISIQVSNHSISNHSYLYLFIFLDI